MKENRWEYLPYLFASVACIVSGILMIVNDRASIGRDGLTQQLTAGGGPLLIFMGIIFLVVTYFSLSPFNRVRQFFNGSARAKKQNKSKKIT